MLQKPCQQLLNVLNASLSSSIWLWQNATPHNARTVRHKVSVTNNTVTIAQSHLTTSWLYDKTELGKLQTTTEQTTEQRQVN